MAAASKIHPFTVDRSLSNSGIVCKLSIKLFALLALMSSCTIADPNGQADLLQRVAELEKRVVELETRVDELGGKNRWKDEYLWARLKKDMADKAVEELLGKPARVEQRIFTTWYYHPTSKLHSYVWFDEGRVLGWEAPVESSAD